MESAVSVDHAIHDPYIVGRWVRRHEHYARHSLIQHLLTAQDDAFWLVGTRRMGKTSLLRQIEFLTSRNDSHWVPLFWDMQGCTLPEELSAELRLALHDNAGRFAALDIDLAPYQESDAPALLRTLTRAVAAQGRQLLLLIDEGEVLVEVATASPTWLARLRKALQEGNGRTILASTQYFSRLNDVSVGWTTSPFLFGFQQLNLWTLDARGAAELARQTQSGFVVDADADLLDDILTYTAQHPYLIQFLCRRLFVATGASTGYLRPLVAADLELDHLLEAYFRIDYQQIVPLGQRILFLIAESATITEEQLAAVIGQAEAQGVGRQLRTLLELGYLRRVGDNWMIGNEFLRRWLFENRDWLASSLDQPLRDDVRIRSDTISALSAQLGVAPIAAPLPTAPPIQCETEFYLAVQQIMATVRRLIEQDDGHKLLVNNLGAGRLLLRSEEEVQIALKHWFRPLCEAVDIDLNREPLTGRGYLDFKFSIGRKFRCLMEVKLFNSSKLEDGVGIQLPLYLLADQATYGIYVPVFLEDSSYAAALPQLHALAQERALTHRFEICVMDVRAWKPKSASKADGVEEYARYYLQNTFP